MIVEQKKETILVFRTSVQLKRSLPSLLRGGESLLSLIQLALLAEVVPDLLLRESQVVLIVGILGSSSSAFMMLYERILVGFASRRIVLLPFLKRRDVIVKRKKEAVLVVGALF